MNIIRTIAIFLILITISCKKNEENKDFKNENKETTEIITKKISKENLPKEITFEGTLIELTKLKDIDGEHIILLTATEKTPSKKLSISNTKLIKK